MLALHAANPIASTAILAYAQPSCNQAVLIGLSKNALVNQACTATCADYLLVRPRGAIEEQTSP